MPKGTEVLRQVEFKVLVKKCLNLLLFTQFEIQVITTKQRALLLGQLEVLLWG